MGLMLDGVYHAVDPAPDSYAGGEFKRAASPLRTMLKDPNPADLHLFVAWNCPWAHRALLARAILGLSDMTVSYAKPRRTDQGWVFKADGGFSDPLLGVASLHEVYAKQRPNYTGRITVPVLWDKSKAQIVSNESADILRMLGGSALYPATLQDQIDKWNDLIYPTLNNGVYRAGFARSQEAYEAGVRDVFATLELLEDHLSNTDWLAGDQLTEADLRLFPTLARFDVAYHSAFKCNIKRLTDYPNLWRYARRIYAMPGVAETVDFEIYKQGYFSPSELRNPLGIVPLGPLIDWSL